MAKLPTAVVIERLGGTRAAAKLLNVHPSTVQSWKDSGFFPSRRLPELARKIRAAGYEVSCEEMTGIAA